MLIMQAPNVGSKDLTKDRGIIGKTRFQRKVEEGGIDSTNGWKKCTSFKYCTSKKSIAKDVS